MKCLLGEGNVLLTALLLDLVISQLKAGIHMYAPD